MKSRLLSPDLVETILDTIFDCYNLKPTIKKLGIFNMITNVSVYTSILYQYIFRCVQLILIFRSPLLWFYNTWFFCFIRWLLPSSWRENQLKTTTKKNWRKCTRNTNKFETKTRISSKNMKKLEKKQEKFDKKDESKPTCVNEFKTFCLVWRHVTLVDVTSRRHLSSWQLTCIKVQNWCCWKSSLNTTHCYFSVP